MSIKCFGSEIGFFLPSDVQASDSTQASRHNTSFVRASTYASGLTGYFDSPEITPVTDCWVHVDLHTVWAVTGTSTLSRAIEFLDDAGTAWVRLMVNGVQSGVSTMRIDYWTGAAWVSAGSVETSTFVTHTLDFHIVSDTASGSIDMYMSGTRRIESPTINLSGFNGLAQFRGWGRTNSISVATHCSQVVIADESTIGMRLVTMYASGAGASTAWTGSYTSIDEAVYDDADFIFSDTANEEVMFAGTLVGSLTGYNVRAVGVAARVNTAGTGPANIKLGIRSGGTNYYGATQALDFGYGNYAALWETDPATTLPWINTAASAIQFGAKSIT